MNPVANHIFASLQRFHIRFNQAFLIAIILHVMLAIGFAFFSTYKKVEHRPTEIYVKLGSIKAPTSERMQQKSSAPQKSPSAAVTKKYAAPTPVKPEPTEIVEPTPPAPDPKTKQTPKEEVIAKPKPPTNIQAPIKKVADALPKPNPKIPEVLLEPQPQKTPPTEEVKQANFQQYTPPAPSSPAPPAETQDSKARKQSDVAGHELGNRRRADQQIAQNYRQLLSLWMEKHKDYPPAAISNNIEGEAIIQVHIDDEGNILRYKIEKKTGKPILDQAIIQMLQRATPVPPPPSAEQLRNFRLAIDFTINRIQQQRSFPSQ